MPTTTTLPDGYRRDRNGFPVGPCRRCGGSGRYSFNLIHLDMCYGCQGTGWQYAVPKHHAAWRDEVRAAVRVVTENLQPGDTVRPWGARTAEGRPEPGRTVTAIEVSDESDGYSAVGVEDTPGYRRTVHYWRIVTWDDGTTERVGSRVLWHRDGVRVDPAPFVARAERGLAYLLSRRNP